MNAKRITSLGISLAGGDQLQPEVRIQEVRPLRLRHGLGG